MPVAIRTSRSSQALETGNAKLWMLLVGINQYQDEQLTTLRYSAFDCQGLGNALMAATQAFPKKEAHIHHDFSEQPPHLSTVQASLEHIVTTAASQDTVLLYFSGHGVLEPSHQQAVLCLTDTYKDQLLETGLPLSELLRQLASCAAHQQIVWLDTCHSGDLTLRGARGVAKLADALPNPTPQLVDLLRQRAAQSKGFYALLSCDQTQRSWEFPELGHGVFTYFLMRGLRGEAADAQGVIEADGLYKYVYYQTLQYVDKTNQQIRLVNQQRSSRSDQQLQSEFPLQTPKRIVEGIGELVLGVRSPSTPPKHPRQALIIEGLANHQTTLELSKVLRSLGAFELEYLPRPGCDWENLRQIIQTFLACQPEDEHVLPAAAPPVARPPQEGTTALLYLRGRLEETPEGEAWLVFGNGTRLNRSWLRQALRRSPITQQIIIFDCPGATSLHHWVEDLHASERGLCLIAAAPPLSQPEQFTQTLLDTLNQVDLRVGLPAAAWIAQLQVNLADTGYPPLTWLSAAQGVIEVVPSRIGAREGDLPENLDLGVCPYMGLRAFSEEGARYFYGREWLTQHLINALRDRSTLAIVGASGSGKSSVVQAGLIAQLRWGKQIPGSDQWWIGSLRPGANPLDALARRLVDAGSEKERDYQKLQIEGLLYQGVDGFVQCLRTRSEPMVVLVVDQFEELFTLSSQNEREKFLELILGALQYAGDRFKLIFTLRTDFITPCLAIPALAQILQQSSILVPPTLEADAYRQAIINPAEQVGLTVEPSLVEVLLPELHFGAGELPLLEFLLEQLWEQRETGQLTLRAYQKLGGLKGAIERQAQEVYDALDPEAQACARWIFLNLTQLGDGTEDTRRRISKSDLRVPKYSSALVERTLQALTAAKLVVVDWQDEPSGASKGQGDEGQGDEGHDKRLNALDGSSSSPEITLENMPEVTIDIVHEILIRHWSTLRWWLEENRASLRLQRQLEQAAALWQQREYHPDYLLRGGRLAEAEELYIKYTDELSESVQQFIEACLEARQQDLRLAKQRIKRLQITAVAIAGLGCVAMVLGGFAYRQQQLAQIEGINALDASSEALLWSNQPLESLLTSVNAGRRLEQMGGMARWWVGSSAWTTAQVKTAGTLQQSLTYTQELNRLEHNQSANAGVFSPDGQLIATACHDGTVKIWRRDGSILTILADQTDQVNQVNQETQNARSLDVVFSPDGTMLATALSDHTIKLWQITGNAQNTTQITLLKTLKGHQDWVSSVAFSPDGQVLVSGSRDRTLKLWQLNGTLIKTLAGHQGWVNRVSFSPDGQRLASASEDKTIRIWRRDGVLVKVLNGHGDRVTDLSFSADGTLASASGDGTVRSWNLNSGKSQRLFQGQGQGQGSSKNQVNGVSFSPNGQAIATASADGKVRLWRKNGQLLQTFVGHAGEVLSVRFNPAGDRLITASADKTVRLWTTEGQAAPPENGNVLSVRFRPQTPTQAEFVTAGWDNDIRLWQVVDPEGRQLVRTFKGHSSTIAALRFTPNGQTLASASWDKTIKLWRAGDGTLLSTLQGHQDGVTSLDFSSDGQTLVSGSEDKTLKLWRVADGTLLKTLQGHQQGITSVAFSPDGQTIASGSHDQTVKLWHSDGTLLQTIAQPDLAVLAVQFSPDGQWLAIARQDNTLQLWRVHPSIDKQPQYTLTGHTGSITSVDFSPDHQALVSTSADGTVRLWNLADGSLIKILRGHTARINSVHFAPDSHTLLSGDDDGNVKLWHLDPADLVKRGCDRLQDYLKTNPMVLERDRHLCR
jgi:WD40 repeat protein/uncharacterized caspase-like protein